MFRDISSFSSAGNHEVSVVSSSDKYKTLETKISKILSEENVPHRVLSYNSTSDDFYFLLNSSAIVLLDSYKDLRDFNDQTLLTNDHPRHFQFFIYCDAITDDKLLRLDQNLNSLGVLHLEYFIVEQNDSFKLKTFEWHTKKKCGVMQLIEVNSWSKAKKCWEKESFAIEKFLNFHGCTLLWMFKENHPEFIINTIDRVNQIIDCSGYLCEASKDIARNLNFRYRSNAYMIRNRKPIFRDINYDLVWIYINLGIAHRHGKFLLPQMSKGINKFFLAHPVKFLDEKVAHPPGFEYDAYEKMLLPFDEETWMWIAITFSSAFTLIIAMRFARTDIRDFLFGTNVSTPALNVLAAFFGCSQIVCPGRNFARFLLMAFILFSLIIRTAYQGKMFEFLQKEMRKPTVDSVEEMLDENYTFWAKNDFKLYYKDTELGQRGIIVEKWKDIEFRNAFELLYKPGSKTAIIVDEEIIAICTTNLRKSEPPPMLSDRINVDVKAMALPRDNHYFKIFNKKILQLVEAGLFDQYSKEWMNKRDMKRNEEFAEPFKILTLGELEAGFVVCMVPLLLSSIAFCWEWLVALKDLLVFQSIFRAYFALKKSDMKRKFEAWTRIHQAEDN